MTEEQNISPPWWAPKPLLSPETELYGVHPPEQRSFPEVSALAHLDTPARGDQDQENRLINTSQGEYKAKKQNMIYLIEIIYPVFDGLIQLVLEKLLSAPPLSLWRFMSQREFGNFLLGSRQLSEGVSHLMNPEWERNQF